MTTPCSIFGNIITGREVAMQILLSTLMFGLILVAGSMPASADDSSRPAGTRSSYDPAILYPGPYTPEHLFYRNPKGTIWLPWIAGDFNKKVKCSGAVKRFKRQGVWKGHLNQDGSCGPLAEPSDWAVGNWLNYVQSSRPRK